jgi:formate--tetrahydrofolate ligase
VQQIEAIATKLYGAAGVDIQAQAKKDLQQVEALGLGTAPVCMAKTHLSLSHDPALRNRPSGFVLPVRGLVPSVGAGFVVALCGEMQRMPGFGKAPAFLRMDIDEQGNTYGLT